MRMGHPRWCSPGRGVTGRTYFILAPTAGGRPATSCRRGPQPGHYQLGTNAPLAFRDRRPPVPGGWTTVAKSKRRIGAQLIMTGLWTAPAGGGRSSAGRGGEDEVGAAGDAAARRTPPGVPHTHSRSSVVRVTHSTVVVRGKRCQIGHFVTAFPARPNPGDDFRDPIEHVRPGPPGGATEQGSHSVQG